MAAEGTTILLAEDDIILAELYTERLKQDGFRVLHAKDGDEALAFLKDEIPALIILDIMMPKTNGLEVLKQIKENPETKQIPVIVVTALVQEIEKINKMMDQADAYIVKSEVLPGEIIEQVKKKLQEHEDAKSQPSPEGTPTPAPAAVQAIPAEAPAPVQTEATAPLETPSTEPPAQV